MGWTLAKPCSQPGMLWIDVNAKIAKTNKRGVASSVRAEQPRTVPTGPLKFHANESLGLTEGLADALDIDHGARGRKTRARRHEKPPQ
jgi:hypothetical protein